MYFFIFLFWLSVGAVFYAYAGYIIILIIVSKFKNYVVAKAPITPFLSLIIAAHNEQENIALKIENSLETNYPPNKREIIVASDGSNDNTIDISEKYINQGIRVLNLPRRGKVFALDEAIKIAQGEILVFTDANTILHPDSLKMLVSNFADPSVGGVCGNQFHLKGKNLDNTGRGESLYWNFDKWLKKLESKTGNIVSADGAVYAIRKNLYRKPASFAVTDDFVISTSVIEQNYRLVFESEAIAYEKLISGANKEFNRKVRIINSGLMGVFIKRGLLNPFKYGFYSLVLISHKILRRLIPLFLIILFFSNIFLSGMSSFYFAALISQILFYFWAAISYLLRNHKSTHWKIFYIPFFYCMANAAALVALVKFVSGRRVEFWNPQRKAG